MMIEPNLRRLLDPLARRIRSVRRWRALALCWSLAAGILFVLAATQHANGWTVSSVIVATGVAAWLLWNRSGHTPVDYNHMALEIERHHPELQALLLAAIEQEPDRATGKLSYLQERVISEAVTHGCQRLWHESAMPSRQLFWLKAEHFAALGCFIVALFSVLPRKASFDKKPTAVRSTAAAGVTVTPGDAEIERGSPVVITARFERNLPANVTLRVSQPERSDEPRSLPLTRNLQDPVWALRIPEVKTDLVYTVDFESGRTADYRIKVFDFPALKRADATLKFPDYTQLPEKKIPDTHRVSAVEGTRLDLAFEVNKPVTSARLVEDGKTEKAPAVISLTPEKSRPGFYTIPTMALDRTRRYRLELVDDAGRKNKKSELFEISVYPNKPPELKVVFPGKDTRPSPIEEVAVEAQATDDFGLSAYGIGYTLGNAKPTLVTLGESAPAHEKKTLRHMIELEKLGAEPDQLLSYFVWAEDLGPDGKPRRTMSDVFFAEIRPFDEIFRQAESSENESNNEAQQQQQQSSADNLIELQKQIVSATWKIQRDERGPEPSSEYRKTNAPTVQESQKVTRDRAEAAKEQVRDPQARAFLEKAQSEMGEALKHLTEAVEKNSLTPLAPALSAEQAAYQTLLKLREREFRVARSQRQNRSRAQSGSEQQRQQELAQMDLKENEQRYETERRASAEQTPQQREELQVLNRLKELARRQQDINEKLKEAQLALQTAKTEQEREEIERELKRLRDKQQEILEDMDRVSQRLDDPQTRSQTDPQRQAQQNAEAREKLDAARSNAQRSAEQLDANSPSQALAAGARAERELEQLREDFRRRTSSQFSEQMRQARTEARDLASKQEELARQLGAAPSATPAPNEGKTLTSATKPDDLSQQLNQQKERADQLLNNLREVAEQAETAEPLLSKEIQDALRRSEAADLPRSLEQAGEALNQRRLAEARDAQSAAHKTAEDLKRGVERAAESVLGDEQKEMEFARQELEDLAQQIQNDNALSQSGQPQNQSRQADRNSLQQGPQNQQGPRGAQNEQNEHTQQSAQGDASSDSAREPQQNQNSPQNTAGNRNGGSQPATAQRGQQSQQGQGRQQTATAQNNNSSARASDETQQSEEQNAQTASAQDGGGAPSNQQQRQQPGQQQSSQNRPGQRTAQRSGNARGGGGGTESAGTEGRREVFITSTEYEMWSDRLRNVEEIVSLPEVQAQLARALDQAREMRLDYKRHSKAPEWLLVQAQILQPLVEAQQRIGEELARRNRKDPLAPVERDPVPQRYSELVRRYYEQLGK